MLKLSFYEKAFLLLILISSNAVLEVNSTTSKLVKNWKRTNKKNTRYKRMSYSNTQAKGGNFNSGYIQENQPKYRNIIHNRNGESLYQQLDEKKNFNSYEDIADFLSIKDLYKPDEINKFKIVTQHNQIPPNHVRLYFLPNFEANSYFYDENYLAQLIKNPLKPFSLDIPADVKLILQAISGNGIGFSDTSLATYPFQNQITYEYGREDRSNVIINYFDKLSMNFLYGEEARNFDAKYFTGFIRKLSYIERFTQIEKISSIMLSPDTFLEIVIENSESLLITKDEPIVRFENPSKILEIRPYKKFYVDLPTVADDCIIVFYEDGFGRNANTVPDTYCLGEIDTNTENHDQIRQTVEMNEYKEKGNIYDFRLKNVGSVVVGKNVTAVLFDDMNYTGRAYPVTDYIASTKYFLDFKKVLSIYILKSGCYIIFPKINFEISHEKNSRNSFRLCYSVDNTIMASESYLSPGSIILGKNTEISLFSERFTGKVIKVKKTTSNILTNESMLVLSIGIDKPQNLPSVVFNPIYQNEVIPGLNIRGCIQLFKEENYQGSSILICDEDTYFTDGYEFKSFKIFHGELIVVCHTKTYLVFYDYDDCVQTEVSLPSYDGISRKFNRLFFIKKHCITLYKNNNFENKFHVLCNSTYDLTREPGSLTEVLSIRKGPEAPKITLYKEINFLGKYYVLNSSESLLFQMGDFTFKSVIFGDEFSTEQQLDTGRRDVNALLGAGLGMFADYFKKGEKSPRQNMLDCIATHFPDVIRTVNRVDLTETASILEVKENHSNFFYKFIAEGFYYIKKCFKWYCNFKDKFYGLFHLAASTFHLGVQKPQITGSSDKRETITKIVSNNQSISIFNLITEIYSPKKFRKSRKRPRRRFRTGRGFFGTIGYYWDMFKEKLFEFYEEYIFVHIKRLKNKIVTYFDFFEKPWFKKVMTAVTCALSGIYGIYDVINGLYVNIQLIILAVAGIVTGLGVLILIDFLFSLLCNYKYFKLAATYFSIGNKYLNENNASSVAYYYYGLGVGAILRAIATTKPITNIIVGIVKSWGNFHFDKFYSRIKLDFKDIPNAKLAFQ